MFSTNIVSRIPRSFARYTSSIYTGSSNTYYNQVPSPGSYPSIPTWTASSKPEMHATTILCVRKGNKVVVIGDGQVSMGPTIVKPNARKVRRIGNGKVIVGFAGATADAFTLVERLEAQLEEYPGQLLRAAVETAKLWRTDRYTRHLEALLIASDENISICLSGNGDVIESHDGLLGIGSGGTYALAAARALIDIPEIDALTIGKKAMKIASEICVYTNSNFVIDEMEIKDTTTTGTTTTTSSTSTNDTITSTSSTEKK